MHGSSIHPGIAGQDHNNARLECTKEPVFPRSKKTRIKQSVTFWGEIDESEMKIEVTKNAPVMLKSELLGAQHSLLIGDDPNDKPMHPRPAPEHSTKNGLERDRIDEKIMHLKALAELEKDKTESETKRYHEEPNRERKGQINKKTSRREDI